MPKLVPGVKAPDFTLPATDGSMYTLSKHLGDGYVVATFYRGDFCPACNRYLHGLQERLGQFDEARTRIVAISSDRLDVERQTVERHQLGFPVLSDSTRRVVDAYDVVYNEREGHAEPAVFVIDPDGALVYESIVSGPVGRVSIDDLLIIVRMAEQRRASQSVKAA